MVRRGEGGCDRVWNIYETTGRKYILTLHIRELLSAFPIPSCPHNQNQTKSKNKEDAITQKHFCAPTRI